MSCHRFLLCAAAFVACTAVTSVRAAVFCVADPLQLSQALLTAQSNAQDDTIELVAGTYLLSSELDYYAPVGETYKIALIGGFDPGCASSSPAADVTVLDGQNMARIFTISAHGEVDISRLTFEHGAPTQYFGGAINLSSDGDIYLVRNEFVANKTATNGAGGALYIFNNAGHGAYVFSNLFLANTSAGGGAIYTSGDGDVYITGNTILANTSFNHVGLTAGIDLAGMGHSWISNNIVWNNDNNDIYDQVGHADYANNDIGKRDGFAPLSESGDLNVDPGFSGFLSVLPGPASPLVNAGLDTPPGSVGGCCDLAGAPRVQGKHVDIGAFETDVLLRNGFDG